MDLTKCLLVALLGALVFVTRNAQGSGLDDPSGYEDIKQGCDGMGSDASVYLDGESFIDQGTDQQQLQLCAKACDTIKECFGVSFDPANFGACLYYTAQTCHHQDSSATNRFYKKVTLPVQAGWTVKHGSCDVINAGGDSIIIRSYNKLELTECANKCIADSNCVAFNYKNSIISYTKICSLRKSEACTGGMKTGLGSYYFFIKN